MILLDCEQNTKEWYEARLGIPTASCFSRLITPKTRKPAAAAEAYRMELLAEWLMGRPEDNFQSDWMQRGFLLQPQAVEQYEFLTDRDVRLIGFAYRDERKLVGASPDGFPAEGNLEIKCRKAANHLTVVLTNEVPAEDMAQIQGQMWVTDRPWCDYMSFHPDLPSSIIRVERDDEYCAQIEEVVEEFIIQLLADRKRLVDLGHTPAEPNV